MHYVISDIHGCYEQYKQMLNLIGFNKNDILYVNGDVLDRGENPIGVFEHMMANSNILPIKGNHEDMGLPVLDALAYDKEMKERDIIIWDSQHNMPSLKGFNKLCNRNKRKLVDYIKTFPMYRTVTVNGIEYVLVHAGFDYEFFDKDLPLDNVNWKSQVWAETDYDKVYYPDKILVTGHTPTDLSKAGSNYKILKLNNHMAIDCACSFGGNLGCICLETGEEFYVRGEHYGAKH